MGSNFPFPLIAIPAFPFPIQFPGFYPQWSHIIPIPIDLENDGLNCSVVIKVASLHIVHGLSRHIELLSEVVLPPLPIPIHFLFPFPKLSKYRLRHRRRFHRGSGKIARVPVAQPGKNYHFSPVLFCPRSIIKCS